MNKKSPLVKRVISTVKAKLSKPIEFDNSSQYWIERYKRGGNSGAGSYNHLAEFKAEVLNAFVKKNEIESVIELGSGDGNQLIYFDFPKYVGFDISPDAIELCKQKFKADKTKSFYLISKIESFKAKMSLSLDVLFHLVEDKIFETYMHQLFDASEMYVVIYSSNFDDSENYENHVRHRKFTDWVEKNVQSFELIEHIPNKYPPESGDNKTSTPADFFIYKKK